MYTVSQVRGTTLYLMLTFMACGFVYYGFSFIYPHTLEQLYGTLTRAHTRARIHTHTHAHTRTPMYLSTPAWYTRTRTRTHAHTRKPPSIHTLSSSFMVHAVICMCARVRARTCVHVCGVRAWFYVYSVARNGALNLYRALFLSFAPFSSLSRARVLLHALSPSCACARAPCSLSFFLSLPNVHTRKTTHTCNLSLSSSLPPFFALFLSRTNIRCNAFVHTHMHHTLYSNTYMYTWTHSYMHTHTHMQASQLTRTSHTHTLILYISINVYIYIRI